MRKDLLHAIANLASTQGYKKAKEAIEKAKNDPNNAFETIVEKEALEFASSLQECEEDNLLWGIPFVCKDNISTKDILTTASSEILKDYVPVFEQSSPCLDEFF